MNEETINCIVCGRPFRPQQYTSELIFPTDHIYETVPINDGKTHYFIHPFEVCSERCFNESIHKKEKNRLTEQIQKQYEEDVDKETIMNS